MGYKLCKLQHMQVQHQFYSLVQTKRWGLHYLFGKVKYFSIQQHILATFFHKQLNLTLLTHTHTHTPIPTRVHAHTHTHTHTFSGSPHFSHLHHHRTWGTQVLTAVWISFEPFSVVRLLVPECSGVCLPVEWNRYQLVTFTCKDVWAC